MPPTVDSGARVKHQYVGDINDYRKYALLRALSAGGANKIGVCWMLTDEDDSSDGSKLGYLTRPDIYREFDPTLFDIQCRAASAPTRRLEFIEASGAVPNALFHNDPLPQEIAARSAFMTKCRTSFATCDLVFFDPDNGIEVPSSPLGRKSSLKYVYLAEMAPFFAVGKSLLIYQHRPQLTQKAKLITDRAAQLRSRFPGAAVWVFTTSDVMFFLVVHPESPARLLVAAIDACSMWPNAFMQGRYLPQPDN